MGHGHELWWGSRQAGEGSAGLSPREGEGEGEETACSRSCGSHRLCAASGGSWLLTCNGGESTAKGKGY